MKPISHRGNTEGKFPDRENTTAYIDRALHMGFECEIDLWSFWRLGHDRPGEKVDPKWILERAEKLWIHCKDPGALASCFQHPELNFFWHDTDRFTMTSHGWVWCYPGVEACHGTKCAVVLPEPFPDLPMSGFSAICSDFIALHDQADPI